MEVPPLGPGGEDITWPNQVAPRGRKASSTRKIKPQTSSLKVQRPLTPDTAHGVQAQDLRPFQKLNKRLVQVVDNGLRLPICSIQLRSG